MIVKTFQQELYELLARYRAVIMFEYDIDYKFSTIKVVNKDNEVLYNISPTNHNKTAIGGLLSDMQNIPPEFDKIIADNFWDLV